MSHCSNSYLLISNRPDYSVSVRIEKARALVAGE